MSRSKRPLLSPKRERRRAVRVALAVGTSYAVKRLPPPRKMVSLLDHLRNGRTRNVSRTGMCLTSQQLLLPGTILEVGVPKSPAAKSGRRRARVVWVRETSPNTYQVGIRFV